MVPSNDDSMSSKRVTKKRRRRSSVPASKPRRSKLEEVSVVPLHSPKETSSEKESPPVECHYKALLRSALDELCLPSYFLSSCSESEVDDEKITEVRCHIFKFLYLMRQRHYI